jgi:hypothetical protein
VLLKSLFFSSKHQVPSLPWVDPLSVAVYDRWLLVAVRHNQELLVIDLASHQLLAKISHSAAVDLQRVVVQGKQIYLCGGSTVLAIVRGTDLSKLLLAAAVNKTVPVQVTLTK